MTKHESSLNDQVTEAVALVNQTLAASLAGSERAMAASAVRHAAVIALQDAVDHLRQVEILSTAATARALAQIAEGERVEESEKVLAEARQSVQAALANVSEVLARLAPYLEGGSDSPAAG